MLLLPVKTILDFGLLKENYVLLPKDGNSELLNFVSFRRRLETDMYKKQMILQRSGY